MDMNMDIILEKLQNGWNSEEMRILVLASLCIQIGLIFLAPLRKRSSDKLLALTLWLFYLTAELVPTLALGNIGKQTISTESGDSGTIPGQLTILWAPFLVLHLGGPDTITSYAIDDNELWWRHPLGLVVQIVVAVYAFWQSPPNPALWLPTSLVCFAGLVKFLERTLALRSGCRDVFKDQIISELGSENDNKKADFFSMSESESESKRESDSNRESKSERESESKRESRMIAEGYGWFNIFKRLLVDVDFSSHLLLQSQNRFAQISARKAINLIAIELSFLYDILHTKAVHKHCILGRVLHCSSLVSIIAALVVFLHLDKQTYASTDIIITYILFSAGLGLEVIATFLLAFSDWTVVSLRRTGRGNGFASVITSLVKGTLRKGKPRWSKTIGQYNLVGLCLRDKDTICAWIMRKLKIKHKWDNMCESSLIPIPELLEEYMFTEALRRALNIQIYYVLIEARSYKGMKALERHGQLNRLEWSMRREFDQCIILWHIATDICYYETFTPNQSNRDGSDDTKRDVSWKTSNYMIYLLTQQQSMMQLGNGKRRFDATCSAVKKILQAKRKKDYEALVQLQSKMQIARTAVKNIFKGQRITDLVARKELKNYKPALDVDHPLPEGSTKDHEKEMAKLVLRDCRYLANELHELKSEIRWKLISETWMEMLGYTAIHCDSYQHARTLSRGGELLTHLWLLMAQMGIVEEQKMQQYQSGSV